MACFIGERQRPGCRRVLQAATSQGCSDWVSCRVLFHVHNRVERYDSGSEFVVNANQSRRTLCFFIQLAAVEHYRAVLQKGFWGLRVLGTRVGLMFLERRLLVAGSFPSGRHHWNSSWLVSIFKIRHRNPCLLVQRQKEVGGQDLLPNALDSKNAQVLSKPRGLVATRAKSDFGFELGAWGVRDRGRTRSRCWMPPSTSCIVARLD